ncbi:HAD-IIA family hydrolase [Oceanobacillus damuensis]|uniref:HAD-IIA family hydrolase n=1 Tax=Oceanobacillus damuensis TaxID=937928 RepID=UPI0008301CF3|nr:HAD-IIA family hydrolase [Oceanobacillus damuensis]
MISLSELKAFFFDLDGSIYRGAEPFQGVIPLLNQLRKYHKTIGFITNNSTHTAREIKEKLNKMNIIAFEEEIISATDYMGIYLADNFGSLTLKVFGTKALQDSIESKGHTVLPVLSKQNPDMIVIARDTTFNYDSLKYIVNAIKSGVKVISTNVDTHHPGTKGEIIPETGSITAAIEYIFGMEIQHIAKPRPFIFNYAMKKFSSNAEQSIMIGDNYNTDITGGYFAGMKTAWINVSGIPRGPKSSVAFNVKPTIIINEIREFIEIYHSSKLL